MNSPDYQDAFAWDRQMHTAGHLAANGHLVTNTDAVDCTDDACPYWGRNRLLQAGTLIALPQDGATDA
jgi:hypothetical protein